MSHFSVEFYAASERLGRAELMRVVGRPGGARAVSVDGLNIEELIVFLQPLIPFPQVN